MKKKKKKLQITEFFENSMKFLKFKDYAEAKNV